MRQVRPRQYRPYTGNPPTVDLARKPVWIGHDGESKCCATAERWRAPLDLVAIYFKKTKASIGQSSVRDEKRGTDGKDTGA